jgi:hypothetical protein
MLGNLDAWLATSIAHAQKKQFEPNVLCTARLAPDQYSLVRQVQAACDSAKSAAARLSGKEQPKHPDTEQTMDELRARVATVLKYLGEFKAGDFEGADARRIDLPFLEGKWLHGSDYLEEMVVPNFYFHTSHVYAILRHSGVDLGKRDYIGMLTLQG